MTRRAPHTLKKRAADRLTKLGDRLRNVIGDQAHMSYRLTRADIDVIQMAADILAENAR